jgi:hypothetical protein
MEYESQDHVICLAYQIKAMVHDELEPKEAPSRDACKLQGNSQLCP